MPFSSIAFEECYLNKALNEARRPTGIAIQEEETISAKALG